MILGKAASKGCTRCAKENHCNSATEIVYCYDEYNLLDNGSCLVDANIITGCLIYSSTAGCIKC